MSAARVASVVLVACALTACPSDPRDVAKRRFVAKVGDVEFSEPFIMETLAQRGTARVKDPAERAAVARAVLEALLQDELVVQAAQKAGITVRQDDVEREIHARLDDYPAGEFQRVLVAEQVTQKDLHDRVQRRLLQDAYLRTRLAQLPAVSDEEIKSRYDDTVANKKIAEQVHARQILVRTSEEAVHVLDAIRSRKMTFEAAAQKHSTGPEAESGGDLGWFTKQEMPDVFEVCFNLDDNTVSDIVPSGFGFHIFQILSHRDEHVESMAEARAHLEEDLAREHQTRAVDAIMQELTAGTKVTINEGVLAQVVKSLPEAPVTPNLSPDEGVARSLDSNGSALNSIPELPKD